MSGTAIYVRQTLTPDFSRHIPCVVVQGRYDVICPVSSDSGGYFSMLSEYYLQAKTAYDLKKVRLASYECAPW